MKRELLVPFTEVYAYGSGRQKYDRRAPAVPLSTGLWVMESSYNSDGKDRALCPQAFATHRYTHFGDAKGVLMMLGHRLGDEELTPEVLLTRAQSIEVPERGWTGGEAADVLDHKRGAQRGWRLALIPAQQIEGLWGDYRVRMEVQEKADKALREAQAEQRRLEHEAFGRVRELVGETGTSVPSAFVTQPFRTLTWQGMETILRAAIENGAKK